MAFAILIGFMPQSLVGPALTAILSGRAGSETQGEVQGMAAMAQGIAGIIAPILINPTMAYFTSPAAPFQFAGAGFIVSIVFATVALARMLTLPRAPVSIGRFQPPGLSH